MTHSSLAVASPGNGVPVWPAGDTVILRSRTVRPGTPLSRLSRFVDLVWILQPAHADDHHTVNSLRWERFPASLVLEFKTFTLAALDHPYPPVLAIERRSQRMAVDTVSLKVRDLRVFAQWMADRGLESLSEVTAPHLDAYRNHVLALAISAPRKADLLGAVRLLWEYREFLPQPCRLPEAAPWGGASGHSLAKVKVQGGGGKTPRVDPVTMESLLGWSLRMLENFGPDIADAWQEYRQLNTGTHPSQRRFDGLSRSDRLELFLAEARRDGTALPGQRNADGSWEVSVSHLTRLLGLHGSLSPGQVRRAGQSGLVAPVHAAIAMLERLTDHAFVFPASHVRAQARREAGEHARASRYMTRDLEQFAEWVNTTFTVQGGELPIPPDPTKHIHARRFRRSLAYFIVRRPRGLIAAALQYGHVSSRVTLNYSGTADTNWMEDLAVERLELVLEQTDRDWSLLDADEHVSGPSAAEYRDRIARARRFEGRVIRSARNLERLLASTDSGIHHGQAMTCVWRTETAACRTAKITQGLPTDDAPDESECRTTCQNLAYTDRDIQHVREEAAAMRQAADDPLAPRPIRDRAATRATRLQAIIERHEASRPTTATPADQHSEIR